FFFSSRRRHTRWPRDWSSDVCSSDLFLDVRLAQNRERRSLLRLEKSFHRGKRRRLAVRDHFSLHVSGREELQQSGDRSDKDSCSNESAPVIFVALRQQIERPHPGHHEASGLHCEI